MNYIPYKSNNYDLLSCIVKFLSYYSISNIKINKFWKNFLKKFNFCRMGDLAFLAFFFNFKSMQEMVRFT